MADGPASVVRLSIGRIIDFATGFAGHARIRTRTDQVVITQMIVRDPIRAQGYRQKK